MITDKIEEAKNCFQTIKQSGRNNYQKYNYFETRDIFPIVRKICKKYRMKTKFEWDIDTNQMFLIITDKEDGTTDISSIPVAPVTATDPGKYMQDVGRIQTYAQRYLYIQVFEIAVPDEIDNRDQKKIPKSKPKSAPVKKSVAKVEKPEPEPVEETAPTQEDIKEALDNIYNLITSNDGEFNIKTATFQLRRRYKDKPRLVEACINSLNMADGKDDAK